MSTYATFVTQADSHPRAYLSEQGSPIIDFANGGPGIFSVTIAESLPAEQVEWLRRLSVSLDELSDEVALRAIELEGGEPA